MPPCTMSPPSFFVNFRAFAQRTAWETYYEIQDTAADTAADANESLAESEKGIDESSTGQGRGGREGGSPHAGRKVLRRALGPHEQRLTQTFPHQSPPDAVLIAVPSYYDDDWKPNHSGAMGKPQRGFQPTNTLGNSAPQAADNFFTAHANKRSTALPTQTVKGGNVRRANDPFEKHEAMERTSKRQRMNPPGNPSLQSSPHTVDLTDDAEDVVFGGVAYSNTRGAMPPTRQSREPESLNPFAMNESLRASSFTKLAKPSQSARRRGNSEKRNGSQRSSGQRSASSPTVDDQDSFADLKAGSRNSPMVIDGAVDGKRASLSQYSSRRPPIDLVKGLPPIQKVARGSQTDLQNANNMLRTERQTNEPPRLPQRVQTSGRQQQHADLRRTFVRDAPPHQSKAKDRMRAESTKVVASEGSSPDQLEGDRTIPNHSSPYKESNRAEESSAETNIGLQVQLSSGGTSRFSRARVVSPPSDDDTEDVLETGRISIRSIFSKQCIQEQEGLSLVWDSKGNRFFVDCGEKMACLPQQNALVTIGKDEVAHSWQHSSKSAKAMLKGFSTGSSNGNMIIEFENRSGLNACYNFLTHATNNCMTSIPADPEYMEKLFETQRKALREAHNRLLQTLENRTAVLPADRRAKLQAEQGQSEDEIQYESDFATRSEARAQIRQRARDTVVHSHHFSQEPARRSTRQVKPYGIRPISPTTPPKWSDENELPTWQHPVVYPSQGERRVTVYDSDLPRLDEGEYLNDNLLGFAIRRIEETMEEKHRGKVHFFNTFFYSTLVKKSKIDYEAVRRWTKKTDIFSIPYTVVPINNDLHWYFAIICNLEFLARKPLLPEDQPENLVHGDVADVAPDIIDVDRGCKQELPPISTDQSGESSNNGIDEIIVFNDSGKVLPAGDDIVADQLSTGSAKKAKKAKQKAFAPTRKYDTTSPVIIMLDSFGHARSAESTNLKKYIQAEAREKRAMDVDYKSIQGVNAKGLPAQPNFCDCGVFVIGYLMEFAKDPDEFVKKVLRRELDAERDFSGFSAPSLRNDIRQSLFKVAEEQAEERRVLKAQKRARNAQRSSPPKASKHSSPAPPLQTAHETSYGTPRATSSSGPPAAKCSRTSPIPTSETAPQSSVTQATPGKPASAGVMEDDLEYSAPKVLALARNAPTPSNSDSSDSDEDMLDVATNEAVPVHGILPNPYSQKPIPSLFSPLTALTSRKTPSGEAVIDEEESETPAEIPESQEIS